MPRPLDVYLLPDLATPEQLAGTVAVVIDVLRASTTIVYALAAGAREVIPCLEVAEARQAAAKFSPGQVVLGGERGGVRIDGFDLGNSPSEYTSAAVGEKVVVFSTTNGTKALTRCGEAAEVLIGSFANLVAVCRRLREAARPIALVCAGTKGQITREDVLLAGVIVHLLLTADREAYELNDQAHLAADSARQTLGVALAAGDMELAHASLLVALRGSIGGRDLIELGMEADIVTAARMDCCDFVPRLDHVKWTITRPDP